MFGRLVNLLYSSLCIARPAVPLKAICPLIMFIGGLLSVAFIGGLLGATFALAQDAAAQDVARIEWVRTPGTEGCMSEWELVSEITRYRPSPAVVSGGDGAKTIVGRVVRWPKSYEVMFEYRKPDGTVVGRRQLEKEANDCRQLDKDIVAVFLLLIDPEAAGNTPDAAPDGKTARISSSSDPSTRPESAPEPSASAAPNDDERPPRFVDQSAPVAKVDKVEVGVVVGVGLATTFGWTPGLSAGPQLQLAFEFRYLDMAVDVTYLPHSTSSTNLQGSICEYVVCLRRARPLSGDLFPRRLALSSLCCVGPRVYECGGRGIFG